MPSVSRDQICADCATVSSDLSKIRNRYLCPDCFTKYVLGKVRKRLEPYGFKHQVGDHQTKVLLPLSGGSSSLVLLHALDLHLKRQIETRNKQAFDLVLVHITSDEHEDRVQAWRESISSRFGAHEFLPSVDLSDVFQYDDTVEDSLRSLGLARRENEHNATLLARLFDSTRTLSAKADLKEILVQRLLVGVAKSRGCENVIWGHSDSRLAAKALADVAKGRGGSSSTAMADGMSMWGLIFNFPVRELYKVELDLYLQYQTPDLSQLVLETDHGYVLPVSIRNTSIDALLNGYIASQGEKYPSIMANVVRTAGKLQTLPPTTGQICMMCSMPIPPADQKAIELCYGCNRMKQDIKI